MSKHYIPCETLLTACLYFLASSGLPGVKAVRQIEIILRNIQLQNRSLSVHSHLLQFHFLAVHFLGGLFPKFPRTSSWSQWKYYEKLSKTLKCIEFQYDSLGKKKKQLLRTLISTEENG